MYSCPICWRPLFVSSPRGHTRSISGNGTDDLQLPEYLNLGMNLQTVPDHASPLGASPNHQQNASDTIWRFVSLHLYAHCMLLLTESNICDHNTLLSCNFYTLLPKICWHCMFPNGTWHGLAWTLPANFLIVWHHVGGTMLTCFQLAMSTLSWDGILLKLSTPDHQPQWNFSIIILGRYLAKVAVPLFHWPY